MSLASADRKTAGWVFATFLCLYLLTSGGHFYASDSWQKFEALRAMVFHGTVFFKDGWTPGIGGSCAFYPLGGSLLMIPGFAVGFALAPLAPMIPAEFVARFAITLQNAFITAGLVTLVFAQARRLGYAPGAAFFAAAALGLGSMAWPYAKTCWNEPGTALFVFGAFYALQVMSEDGFKRLGPIVTAGVLLAAAVSVRLETAMIVPGALAWLLWRHWGEDWRPLARAAAVIAVPGLVAVAGILWYNAARYGHPLTFSNWNAVMSVTPMPHGRLWWALGNLWHYTLNPGDGIPYFSPVVLLGLAGWPLLHRDRPAASWLVLLAIGPLFVFYFAFWGLSDWAWGMRYGYTFLPFLVLPVAALWAHRPDRRGVAAAVFALGVAVQLVAVLHNFGFLYERERARHPGLSIQQLMARPEHAPLLLALRDTPATLQGGVDLLRSDPTREDRKLIDTRTAAQFVPDVWPMLLLLTTIPRWLVALVAGFLAVALALCARRLRACLIAAC